MIDTGSAEPRRSPLAETWPASDTWRGFTASISEALYVTWIVAAPIIHTWTWIMLGGALMMAFAVRTAVLRMTMLASVDHEIESQRPWPRRYSPLTYFFHRNFTLHATGFLALFAHERGGFLLVITGAATDFLRERNIRRGDHGESFASDRVIRANLPRLLGPIAIFLSCAVMVFLVPSDVTALRIIDQFTKPLGDFVWGIFSYSRYLEIQGDFEQAVRFRTIMSMSFVYMIYYLIFCQAVMIRIFLNRPVFLIFLNPLVISVLQFMVVGFFYIIIALYGGNEFHVEKIAHATIRRSFEFTDSLELFAGTSIVAWIFCYYFGMLTQVRAGRDAQLS